MDPSISIYRRGSDLIAIATGLTAMGVEFETGPGLALSTDLPADQIGLAIIELFASCGATVEHPKTFGGPDTLILQLAKASSWTNFMRSRPEHMTATLTDASVVVEQWRREGSGFSPTSPLQEITLPRDVAPRSLGDVLLGRTIRQRQNKT